MTAPQTPPMDRRRRNWLRHLRRSETGAVTLPTLLWLPFFLMIMVSSVELLVLSVKQTMLERGVDMSTRILRLGIEKTPSAETLKRSICENIGFLHNCMDDLFVEVHAVDTNTWATVNPDPGMRCVDRDPDSTQVATVDGGNDDQMMLLRACLKIRPMSTGSQTEDGKNYIWEMNPLGAYLLTDMNGEATLTTTTFYINEPG
ncbi:TadE/TadG family type IV pilus assembly protein [Thioclava sp. SK-1]|uniref:TadE/TadG family type IV pilus assembly protein n=1 Tax=Thioclava sp. SK-1 TaxID=1889770 RepID=UPI00114C984B|nr:hypothetical protein [Thioclava sp. SK-1]